MNQASCSENFTLNNVGIYKQTKQHNEATRNNDGSAVKSEIKLLTGDVIQVCCNQNTEASGTVKTALITCRLPEKAKIGS